MDELEEKLKHKLEGYERLLAKQKWVGGDRPTLVDLFHIPFPNVLLSVSDMSEAADWAHGRSECAKRWSMGPFLWWRGGGFD